MEQRLVALALAVAAVVLSAAPAHAETITVRSADMGPGLTWEGYALATGSVDVTGVHGAPSGFGSSALSLATPGGFDKAGVRTTPAAQGIEPSLGTITDISYWTFRDPDSTAPSYQTAALNVAVDVNGVDVAGGTATLVFEPLYTYLPWGIAAGVWQRWDADGAARWWSTSVIPGVACPHGCYATWDTILAANPDAEVLAYGINQGTGNAGLSTAVDGLAFGGVTADFEQHLPTKDDCKRGGWARNFPRAFRNQGECVASLVRTEG